MVAKNDITGDSISTKHNSQAFSDNWDLIWGKKKETKNEMDTSVPDGTNPGPELIDDSLTQSSEK